MLLIENTEPCVRLIGNIRLIPGINRIDEGEWEGLKPKYLGPVEELIEQGVFVFLEADKPSIQIVKKTYDINLLNAWKSDAKGPVQKAIKEQLKKIIGEEKKDGDA